MIWKANQQIPTLHYELCKIMHDAGVPKEVLQMVQFAPGTEPERTEQLIAHPDIKLVNFTGSIGVGSSIGALAGKYIKPALLELGGNAPAVILEDADLAMAANNIVFGGMLHSGHICMSTARIVVLESVADQLVSELEKIVAGECGVRFLLVNSEVDDAELVPILQPSSRVWIGCVWPTRPGWTSCIAW